MSTRKRFLVISLFLAGILMVHFPVLAQNYFFEWAKGIGGKGAFGLAQASSLATDNKGNVYTTGLYHCDSADFDPGPGTDYLYGAGGYASFISKLDAAGNHIWARGIPNTLKALDIATDTAENVYITGWFTGTADFDPGSNTANLTTNGGEDIFVCKFDKEGNYVWARKLGGLGTDNSRGIAVDASGNVYVAGYFNGTADFDPGPDTANLTANWDYDAFICKLDKDGRYVWAKSWGGSGWDWSKVAVDAAGNVYTTGVFWFTVDFDPGPNVANLSAGTFAAFVSKLDASGNYVWAKAMRGNANAGYDLVIANTGVYITGTFEGTVDFDPGPNTANLTANGGSWDIFVCKLDTGGNYLWAKTVGGPAGSDWGMDIAVDAVDNVYILSMFYGTVDFDPGPGTANLISKGSSDVAILKLGPSGNYLWSGSMGCPDDDYTGGIGVSSGNIYAAGTYYRATIEADPTSGIFEIAPISVGQYPGNMFISKVFCGDTSSSELTVDTCGDYTLGAQTYTMSGTYVQALSGILGCDSTITLHLTITKLDPRITTNEFVLGTVETYDSYQWLLDDQIIPGATDSTYTVSANGNYRVIVRRNNCTDTSAVYEVTNYTGIQSIDKIVQQTRVYPNPAQDVVYIQSIVPVNIALSSIEGKVIRETEHISHLSLGQLAEGIYFLRITDQYGNLIKVEKIVKQE